MSDFINALFPLVKAFKDPSFSNILPSIWIGLIFFIFIVSLVSFLWFKIKCQTNIDDILKTLSEFKPEALVQDYEKLNQKLSENPFIGHFWSEFDETLIKIKDAEGREEIFNSIDAGYFFNEENLIFPQINFQFYKTVPSMLTGLGILGTFLGLTFGLSQVNLAISDIDVLKKGISSLLSGASMAFSTSVWGIALSIIFLSFKRIQLGSLSRGMARLQKTIDHLFIHKRPEVILSGVLEEERQQTLELKRFNEDLAISIASALDEKLSARLTPTFDKLLIAIEELTKTGTSQVAKTITEGAGREIENLKDTLNKVGETLISSVSQSYEVQERMAEALDVFLKSATEQQDKFRTNVQNITDVLISRFELTTAGATEKLLKSLDEFSDHVSSLIGKLGQETTSISQEMQESMNQLTDLIGQRVEEMSRQHQAEQDQLKQLLAQLNATLKYVEDVVGSAGQVAEAFNQTIVPIKETSLRLSQAVQDIQKSHEFFKETIYSTRDLLEHYVSSMEKSVDHLLDALQRTQSAWRAYETKFGQIKGDLEAVFEEIRKGLRDYTEITGRNIEEILGKFDYHLTDVLKYLGGVVDELRETQEGVLEEIEQLRRLRHS